VRASVFRRSEYRTPFWIALVVGWAVIGYGAWVVVANTTETHPVNMSAFLFGLLLLHDLVIAPLSIAIAAVLRGRLPRVARGALAGAVMISAVTIALVVPAAIDRVDKVAGNPTIVPRNPWVGAAIVVALVWLVAGLVVASRLVPERPRRLHAQRSAA